MRRLLPYLLLLLLFFPLPGNAQISGPATVPAGVAVNFSGPVPGNSYNWTVGAAPVNVDPVQYTPAASNVASAGYLPNQVKMVFDGTNWYSFTILATSGTITRAFYGTDPTSVPVTTPLATQVTTATSNQTKAIDVVYDSTSSRWYIFVAHGAGGQHTFYKLTMNATGLADLNPTIEKIPLVDGSGNPVGFNVTDQLTVRKYNGEWLAFIGGGELARLDLGASLAALSPSTSLVKHVLGIGIAKYFSLYRENGEWFAFSSNGVLSGIYFRRIEFGADLKNNAPAAVSVTVPGTPNTVRSVLVVSGCDNEVFGYVMGGAPTMHMLDFNGSIKNTPSAVTRSVSGLGFSADGVAGVSPFIYGDTLYAAMSEWRGNRLYTLRLLPLTGSQTKYYDVSFQHTFATPGTYTVNLLVNEGDQSGPDAYCHTVTVVPPSGPPVPGPYTSAPVSVCQNSTETYTVPAVSGAVAYHWYYTGSGATYASSTTAATNSVTFGGSATSGTLRVWAIDNIGDSSYLSRDTAIIVNTTSNVSISPATATICAGDSVTLQASGATTYNWSPGGGNTASITVSPATTTMYTVTGGAAGCSDTAMRQVVVTPLPVVSISPATATICAGDSVTLTASGATTYSWSLGSGATASIRVSPAAATMYTVTGTTLGCVDTAMRQVAVTPLPVVSISPATATICAGESVTLTAGGATTYNWSPSGGSSASATVSPSATTTYTVTGTSLGCSDTATRQVVVNPLPVVTISPATVEICAGENTLLTASGADTYVWTPVGGNAATINISPVTTTAYTVEGTHAATGCKDTAMRQVIVYPLPVTQISVTSGATEICAGDSTVLTASGSGYDYEWKNGGALIGTGNRYAVYATGSYKVVATDQASGCSDSTQAIDIRVHPRPVAALDHNDTSFCAGGMVMLAVSTQDTGLTYLWQRDGNTVSLAMAYFLEIREHGIYRVIAGRMGIAACEDTTNEVSVTVYDLPVVVTNWDSGMLHATPGYVSYQWNTVNDPISGATDSTYTPLAGGSYSVTVLDTNGCYGTSAFADIPYINNAVEDRSFTDIRVYPNPSGGMVYIASQQPVHVLLLGSDGRVLQRVQDAKYINLADYAAGLYLLRITDTDGRPVRNEWIKKR